VPTQIFRKAFFRVEIPCPYLSAREATNTFSRQTYRSSRTVENPLLRSQGTRNSRLPIRVTKPRG
jgi:hypothetical protein